MVRNVERTAPIRWLTNVTRPDEVRPSLTAREVLAGAPAEEQQRFSVPRILDAED